MKKVKTSITKRFFKGLRSSQGESEVGASVEDSNHGPKPTVPCSTASQTEASRSTHLTVAKKCSTTAASRSDARVGCIAGVPAECLATAANPSSPASTAIPSAPTIQAPKSTPQKSQESMIMPSRISRSLTELDVAMIDFRTNYELFAKKHLDVVLLDDELNTAFRSAQASDDIKRSAQIFGDGIWAVLQTMETKKNVGKSAWLTKLGSFLTKVYPVAMLSVNFTASIADVPSRAPQF